MSDVRPLSVAHLTASLTQQGSGVKAVVERLSAEAEKTGTTVRVFGFEEGAHEDWDGAPAHRSAVGRPAALGRAPDMAPALIGFAPDVVHAHGLWLHFATAALQYKNRKAAPYVISPHGMLSPVALQIKPWRKRVASVLYQGRLLRQADCLIATSEIELGHIRDAGMRNPVAVIPLGLDDAPQAPAFTDTGEKRVIYLGRKLALKGLEELAMAWGDIAERFPDWRLHIIGPDSGGYEAKLAGLVAAQGIPRLDLLPPVFSADREATYCASQISILPSTTENFALTVGESLVRGIPAIATRATPWAGLEEQQCGLWIDSGRAAIAQALAQLMSLPATERHAMGQRGRDWILRDFQWPVIAQCYNDLYQWLLGRSTCPEFVEKI